MFCTEDGVDVFKGDKFYICKLHDWKLIPCSASKNATFSIDKSKKFSTKEAAEEYILMNKPCLSINDISSMSTVASTYLKNLKELVNQKRN